MVVCLHLCGQKAYASLEGVYIFNEDNVVFHSEEYVIHNAINRNSKPINKVFNNVKKTTKQFPFSKERKYKKSILKEKVSKSYIVSKQAKTLSEKRKRVKECNFVSKVSSNDLSIFNKIPLEDRTPFTCFVEIKEVTFGVEKLIIKVVKLIGIPTIPSFLLAFYMVNSILMLFFCIFIRINAKIIEYKLRRGPPIILINTKY